MCRVLLRDSIYRMQGFTLQRSFATWHHYSVYKSSRCSRAECAVLGMQLSRKHAVLIAWHGAQLNAAHKRALLRRALVHLRHAVVPATFKAWRQHTLVKSSLQGMAHSAMLHMQQYKKHYTAVRAWRAVQQRAQHRSALLKKALVFMRHAVLPAKFYAWRQYSQAKRSRRRRAVSALQQMQHSRKRNVVRAWHAVRLKTRHKRELQSRALAHLRHAILPAAFRAWVEKAAWLADAHRKILHCLQV